MATERRPGITVPAEHRVRRDRIDRGGKVTLCYRSTLLHLGVGRRYAGIRVMLLVADRDVRILNDDGELLAEFRCLIDVKATVHPETLKREWLYQLVGYCLLDYDDRYGINEVGIYLARQARLVRWPLEELLTTLSGGPVNLHGLRDEFQIALGESAG